MWTAILSFLGGPVIKAALDAYGLKKKAEGSTELSAERLASRAADLDVQEAAINNSYKKALIGHWSEPANLMGYIILIYIAKIIIWDIVLGLGTTDAVKGDVAQWMGMYMVFLLGKRGVENTASIIGNVIARVWQRK